MKQDRYFKFIAALIISGVVLAFVQPGNAADARTSVPAALSVRSGTLSP